MTNVERIIHPRNLQRVVVVSLVIMLVCLTTSAIAVTLAYQANAKASRIAVVEAKHSAEQSAFLRDTFCQLVTPLAESTQAPTSPFGQKIKTGSVNANAKLACAPTPVEPSN